MATEIIEDECSITGAAQRTGNQAFECVISSEPSEYLNFVVVMCFVLLVIFWLRLVWQAIKKRNEGKYNFEDFINILVKPIFYISIFTTFILFAVKG